MFLTATDRQGIYRRIAGRTAPWMFACSLVFLVCQAILVVIWVDIPNFSENAKIALDPESPISNRIRATLGSELVDPRIQKATILALCLIWPIVVVESAFHWLTRSWDEGMRRYHFFSFMFCVCPSLRMCARCPEMRYRLWLPGLGWRNPNKRLRRRLERQFSMPMIAIALLIMPVLIIEFFMKTQVAEYAWLRMALHISTGMIWFAFATEFILMLSVADKKLDYCKAHWLDIAIILLPLVSFLRSIRVLRASQALRLPQVTKIARVYRLRGTAVKALRGLIVLEFFHRILRTDVDRSIAKLKLQLVDLEEQARGVRRKISQLERRREDEWKRRQDSEPKVTEKGRENDKAESDKTTQSEAQKISQLATEPAIGSPVSDVPDRIDQAGDSGGSDKFGSDKFGNAVNFRDTDSFESRDRRARRPI